MQARLRLDSLTFSDGIKVATKDATIIALVGPNNSGKSSTLIEIRNGAGSARKVGPVLHGVTFERQGSPGEVSQWLEQHVHRVELEYRGPYYSWLGKSCKVDEVEGSWKSGDLGDLKDILCALIDVEGRLKVANPQEQIDFFSEAPRHPMHVLYKNFALEQKLNEAFRAAFKVDIVLNRGGGKFLQFHMGNGPELGAGEDSSSPGYFDRLRQLPFLHEQGHGMRSFVGCTLHTFTSPAFIHLLDEPEAFLHPPHAKLLAGLLARTVAPNRQLVLATHSGDFLRGLLEANPPGLRVIRLTRDGQINHVRELDGDSIRTLWADPVLRFSNILDAVFHDGVVLCESDGDCRFYAAILGAVLEERGEIPPDIMFAAAGGKDRMPILVQALSRLGVKVRVVADFDVLRDEATLLGIVRALGGDRDFVEARWRDLKTNIHSQTPPLSLNQVGERISAALDEERTASLSDETQEKTKQAMKATSPWHYAKLAGVNAVASGQPRAQLDELLEHLRKCGLFVVRCGEIERFVPSVGGHGPRWVAQALTRDLKADAELHDARQFVSDVLGAGPHVGWRPPQAPPPPTRSDAPSTCTTAAPTEGRSWRSLLKKLGL